MASEPEITDHEAYENLKLKKYTEYSIKISFNGQIVETKRRYADFFKLYTSLKKKFPDDGFKLPGKKLFGNLDKDTINRRKIGFRDFLKKIMSDKKYFSLEKVLQFLRLNGVNQEDIYDVPEALSDDSMEQSLDLGVMEKSHTAADFEFLKMLGKGSFGRVYLAKCKVDNEYFAVKVLSKKEVINRSGLRHVLTEKSVLLKSIVHPFLCGLKYAFQSKQKLYFVLPYINGGELFFHLQKVRTFSEPRARFYAAEMASALGYLHLKDILYRDLKPENILLDAEGHIVLTDFGLSKEGVDPSMTTSTFCGTSEYLAPEILNKEPYNRCVDWWCYGCVLYEMLFGLPPFYSRDFSQMFEAIKTKPLVIKSTCSEKAGNILRRLLDKDHHTRLGSTSDFDEICQHEFFADINWTLLVNKAISPPFKPTVQSAKDVGNFEAQFTKEAISASVLDVQELSVTVESNTDEFIGFSYKE